MYGKLSTVGPPNLLGSCYTYCMRKYELVEVEADGTEGGRETLVATGTLRKMTAALQESIEEAIEDYDERGYDWPSYRVQPAQ